MVPGPTCMSGPQNNKDSNMNNDLLHRRLLEMAYHFCWGQYGSPDLREEFKKVLEPKVRELCPNIGRLTYDGDQCKWEIS